MKIFLGYGYGPRDAWIEDLIVRLIKSFGDEVVSGKEIFGSNLDDGVRNEIRQSDALLGFTTRREDLGNGKWNTHEWVRHELLTAAGAQPEIPFVEVRETGVEVQDGMLANRARIAYDENRRDRCLVDVAAALGRWHRAAEQMAAFVLELVPDDFSRDIRPLLHDPELRSVYRVLKANAVDAGPDIATPIRRLAGRMAIRTNPVPRDAMIQIQVWRGLSKLLWTSDWQAVESRVINMERAN